MAATIRTSIGIGVVEPTGRTSRSCSARSSLACTAAGISPISSRNSVPPVGHPEQARRTDRAGERAALVPEQLALDERLRKGAAVDGDERSGAARTRSVDRPRDQLLAGAALALDEDVALVVLQAAHLALQRADRRGAPDQLGRVVPLGELLLELPIPVEETAAIDRLADCGADPVDVFERFLQVVERAAAHAADRALDARVAGHHDDLDLGPVPAQLIEEVEPAAIAEEQIEQNHVEIRVLETLARAFPVARRRDPMTFRTQNPLDRAEQQRLVVDEQHRPAALLVRKRRVLCGHVSPRGRCGTGSHAGRIGTGIGTLESPQASAYLPPTPSRSVEAALQKSHVLVIDDEELYRKALERILARVGHRVSCARDATEAMAVVTAEPVDLVLCDVRMPGINGLELVRQIREVHPDVPCIVITGYGSPEQSVEALRAGAFWYLEKPFDQGSLDVVRRLVEQAIEHGRLKAENRQLQRQLRHRYRFENIVGTSGALREALEIVEKVADTDSTVLITGESGTGKELFARALHYNSARADRPLVTVNCGAIPEELLESELFGHVRGAFTSAVSHREGRFARAHGGTIFLDEIGDMSANLQVKLLRVLQERTFEPVGSSKPIEVDVRVVAATHQDLELAIRERRFREDLFYRLNVIPIEVPPLRARREDIPELARHFLERINGDKGKQVEGFTDDALAGLAAHDWPGNVRELENLIERLIIFRGEGRIGIEDLPANVARDSAPALAGSTPALPPSGLDFNDVVDRFESELIRQALERTGGNKQQAAQLLGLNRTTLHEKMKKKGLAPEAATRH